MFLDAWSLYDFNNAERNIKRHLELRQFLSGILKSDDHWHGDTELFMMVIAPDRRGYQENIFLVCP